MGIDWRLVPIKVHYFLRFMGTGPLTVFLPMITRQMGVPAHVVGIIWAVLPLASLLTKTTAGAIADITRGHRAVFLMGIVFMVIPLTALYWVPDIPSSSSSPTHNALHSSNASSLPPFSFLTSVTSSTLPVEEEVGDGSFRDTNTTGEAAPTPTTAPLPQEGGDVELLGSYEFWVLFLCLLGQYCGHTTVITMQETVCFQLLGEDRHKYGQQRVWGTIGMGLSAIISGAVVDMYSRGLGRMDYLPAHILTAVFLMADIFLVAWLKFPRPERKMSSSALHGALWRPHVILVLVTTAVVGMMSGVLWTFEFLLVEDVAGPSFPYLRLLPGLLMGVQCFLAEVPFLVLAGRIIQRLGHGNALFVALLGLTLRLVLYYVVTNPWWFLPIDLLHGISFGVAYPCFTSYASVIAPKGAAATTQAIFGAMFFGSTGVGGLVGGRLFKSVGGPKTFLFMGLATGGYSCLFLVVHGILTRRRTSRETICDQDAEAKSQEMNAKEKDMKEKKENEEKDEEEAVRVDLLEAEKGGKNVVMGMSYRRTQEGL